MELVRQEANDKNASNRIIPVEKKPITSFFIYDFSFFQNECIASFIVNRMTMLDCHIGFFMKTEDEVNEYRYYENSMKYLFFSIIEIQFDFSLYAFK